MNLKTAVFPGSFDPFTLAHESIVRRSLPLFGKVIIGIGVNADKKYMFPLEKREQWIREVFSNEAKVEVKSYSGLTVDFCRQNGAGYILRGIRNAADFEFEKAIAQMNRSMTPDVETLCLFSDPEFGSLSSTIIRDIIRNGGDVEKFLPAAISRAL